MREVRIGPGGSLVRVCLVVIAAIAAATFGTVGGGASAAPAPVPGIVALNPNLDCSIQVNGNSTVTVTGGAVIANSSSNAAICGTDPLVCGSFTINASLVATVGGVSDCAEGHINGEVVENADPAPGCLPGPSGHPVCDASRDNVRRFPGSPDGRRRLQQHDHAARPLRRRLQPR